MFVYMHTIDDEDLNIYKKVALKSDGAKNYKFRVTLILVIATIIFAILSLIYRNPIIIGIEIGIIISLIIARPVINYSINYAYNKNRITLSDKIRKYIFSDDGIKTIDKTGSMFNSWESCKYWNEDLNHLYIVQDNEFTIIITKESQQDSVDYVKNLLVKNSIEKG